MTMRDVYSFWFGDGSAPRDLWFKKDDAFDREIARRFVPLLDAPPPVADTPQDRLAEIVLFDQFPRNAFRGTPRSFAYDARALALAKAALARGDLDVLTPLETLFLVLPFEHSENLSDQRECIRILTEVDERVADHLKAFTTQILGFARWHERIIARFGRFPHRNQILGRPSTDEERAFLEEPGSGF